ncbi:hypothetical protein [Mucilaginibacter sp. UYCu711]|uniref:hypothetical protein n=1 Tax=Mucilaginibacter sp. UYCu711 TaxID=3156339 RepID=UPI003D1E4DE9
MKIIVQGLDLTISNANQILNMGGPWIGDISLGTDFISKNCIVDNFVYQENTSRLFFVKYNNVSKYSWYFSINFYNLKSKTIFEFDRVFDMVHLGRFTNDVKLEIYPAFHNQFEDKKEIFNLDEEDFSTIT